MLTFFLPAVAAALLISCGLIVVARMQKRLIKNWVAAGSQSGTFAPEFSNHLRQWSKEFGLWHDVQRIALVMIAGCLLALIGYSIGALMLPI